MEILILTNKFPFPLKDGGAIATYNIMKGLAGYGNHISLLTFNTKKHYFVPEKFPKHEIPNLKIHSLYLNTDINWFAALKNLFFSSRPYILERFFYKPFLSNLHYLLKNQHFDIIQIEGLYLLQYIPEIRKHSKAIISYRAHNIEHLIWQNLAKNKKNIFLKFYLKNLSNRIKKYEKTYTNIYDVLVPISDTDLIFFQKNGNFKPYLICPTGFDKSAFQQYKTGYMGAKLYFIGSLEWMPNREGLLWFIDNCWTELKNQQPEIKLYIAGRNAPDDFIKKVQKPGIIFSGEVENAHSFIKDKSIMIVPLLSGSGMRIKIIEAFFMGKAVVSTKLGATGTKSENGKHLLLAETANEFIQKINLLINNTTSYNQITANSKNLAIKHFDNKKIAGQLSLFYKNLIRKEKDR